MHYGHTVVARDPRAAFALGALLLLACARTPDPMTPLDAELLGWRAILEPRPAEHIFVVPRGSPLVLVVRAHAGPACKLELVAGALRLEPGFELEPRAGGALLRLRVPDATPLAGAASLELSCPDASGRLAGWRGALEIEAPSATRGGAMPEALAPRSTHQGLGRLWALEEATRREARGEAQSDAEAWRSYGRVAWSEGVPTEASRALRVAAYRLIWARALDQVEPLLAGSEAIDQPLGNTAGLIRASYYRGLLALELGEVRAALLRFADAEANARAVGLDRDAAGYAMSAAMASADLGDHDGAVERLSELGPELARFAEPALVAQHRVNLGWALLRRGARAKSPADLGRARVELEAARAAIRGEGASAREANVVLDLAELARREGRLDDAALLLAEARALDPAARGHGQLFARLEAAELALARRQLATAAAGFAAALRHAEEEPGASDYAWRARHGLGRVHLARGDRRRALAAFESALALLHHAGGGAGLGAQRARFLEERRQLSDDAITCALGLGATERALELAEAAEGWLLRDLDQSLGARWESPEAEARFSTLVRRYLELRARLEAESKEGALLSKSRAAAHAEALRLTRAEAAQLFDELLAHRERQRLVLPRATTTRDLRGALGRREALVLLSQVGAEWHGFLLGDGELLHAVLGGDARLPEAWHPRLFAAARLYVVGGSAAGAEALLEIPSSTRVPLAAEVEVLFLSHAALLHRSERPLLGAPLVVADPERNLTFARREGRAVLAALGEGTLLSGPEADREAVMSRLREASVFHFAGHGVSSPSAPWEAHLRLGGGARLSLRDILTLGAEARLVVLGGCETSERGRFSERQGIGLADAFVLAGAEVVLATDRKVDDRAASRFLDAFYAPRDPKASGGSRPPRAPRARWDPAGAYRAAVAELAEAGERDWVAFRLFGTPPRVVTPSR